MSVHLTYTEAIVTGLIQGVTELFPVSSLGHNVLLPALIGGNWAKTLNVSAKDSPYLAFVVGLHVATAVAMIAYFWRDWLRIVRGFFSSLRTRSVSTSDERLAWMIILATIPVGIVGALLQKVFVSVFAKPELTAIFLAINGLILLYSERQRRARAAARAAVRAPVRQPATQAAGAAGPGWQGGQGGQDWGPGGRGGYSQQPGQQHWQGPEDWEYRPDSRGGQDPRTRTTRGPARTRGASRRRGRAVTIGPARTHAGTRGRRTRGLSRTRAAASPYVARQSSRGGRSAQWPPGPAGRRPRAAGYAPRPRTHGAGRTRAPGRDPRGGEDLVGRARPAGCAGPSKRPGPVGGAGPARAQASRDGRDPRAAQAAWDAQDPRQAQARWAEQGYPQQGHPRQGSQQQGGARDAEGPRAVEIERVVRLTGGCPRRAMPGRSWSAPAQVLALLPGISRHAHRDRHGNAARLSTEDAVRFSFLLSAPVFWAACVLKAEDWSWPDGAGHPRPGARWQRRWPGSRLPVRPVPDQVLQRGPVAQPVRHLLPRRGRRQLRLPSAEQVPTAAAGTRSLTGMSSADLGGSPGARAAAGRTCGRGTRGRSPEPRPS